MNWDAITDQPCGILRNGQPKIIALAGKSEAPPFLWYWAGDMNIAIIPGGQFDPKTGELKSAAGETHGWVSILTDMPEITDINQAMAQHRELVGQTRAPEFKPYLQEQIEMAENGIRAGVID